MYCRTWIRSSALSGREYQCRNLLSASESSKWIGNFYVPFDFLPVSRRFSGIYEMPHDKTNNPVWSESSLSASRIIGSLATHKTHSEDSDQTGQMPRLIWVFAGRTAILLGYVVLRLIFAMLGPQNIRTLKYRTAYMWCLPHLQGAPGFEA